MDSLFLDLWEADVNRAEPNTDWRVDLQGSIQGTPDGTDRATWPFFSYVNEKILAKPTYSALIATFDNFVAEVGINEEATAQKMNEYKTLVNEVCKTRVMQIAHRFLAQRGLSPQSLEDFKWQVLELWFTLYSRKSSADSSAYEHVFSGETKYGSILGFHNWVRFFLEERFGRIKYEGYHVVKQHRLFTIGFRWNHKNGKHFTSLFVGVSPEFEMALLTASFLVSRQRFGHQHWLPLHIQAGPHRLSIQCHEMNGRHMGTCYVK
ncbi:hypothetical protein Ciccas_003438 [Cichlidogyrus casuarinus]|uniref:Uridylate-specific endoribonuclease n=1 Tax=Cichlidogyrus casuarinus TaxID=1844966 RepID=A0ABD2QEF1_9PLAT